MKIASCIVSIILIFIVNSIFPSSVSAQNYEVIPALLIPLDYQLSATEIDNYKRNMIQGLREIRQWYASKSSGKTFQLDEGQFQVVNSSSSVGDLSKESHTWGLFLRLGGDIQILRLVPGIVYAVAIVGSGDLVETGGPGARGVPESGFAIINQYDLFALGGQGHRNEALGTWTHELGHAFGLVNAGYAKAHPCTVESTDECQDNAPRPLPQPQEWNSAVMGLGAWSFPSARFNNSVHNPEIYKIYQSKFINPQGDPAPRVTNPRPTRLEISIDGNTANNQVFTPLQDANFAVKVFNDALNPNNGCVPTDLPISFNIGGAFLGNRLACQPVFYRMPDVPGTVETLVVEFPGEGDLQPARAELTFSVPLPGVSPSPSPQISPTPTPQPPDAHPIISNIEPTEVRVGERLTIYGSGFGRPPGEVIFYHKLAAPIHLTFGHGVEAWANTGGITITVPDNALSGSIIAVRKSSGEEESYPHPITVIRREPIPSVSPIPSYTPSPQPNPSTSPTPTSCAQPSESGCPIHVNSSVTAVLGSPSDIHLWTLRAPTSGELRVVLTNLAVDYDLAVYYADNRVLVGYSSNEGTEDDTVLLPQGPNNYLVVVGSGRGEVSTIPYQLDVRGQTISPTPAPSPTPTPSPTGTPQRTITSITINNQTYYDDLSNLSLDIHLPGTEGSPQLFPVYGIITYSDGTTRPLIFNFNYLNYNSPGGGIPSPTPTSSPIPTPTPRAGSLPPITLGNGYYTNLCGTGTAANRNPNTIPGCEHCNSDNGSCTGDSTDYVYSFSCTGLQTQCNSVVNEISGPGLGTNPTTHFRTDLAQAYTTYGISVFGEDCYQNGVWLCGTQAPKSYMLWYSGSTPGGYSYPTPAGYTYPTPYSYPTPSYGGVSPTPTPRSTLTPSPTPSCLSGGARCNLNNQSACCSNQCTGAAGSATCSYPFR